MATDPKAKITVEVKVAPKARPASEVVDDLREMNRIAAEDGEGPIKQISEAISTIGRLRSRLLVCQVELDNSRKRETRAANLVREQVQAANKLHDHVRACVRDGRVSDGEGSPSINDLRAELKRTNNARKPLTVTQAMEVADRTDAPDMWLGTIVAIVAEADAIRLRAAEREAGGGTVHVNATQTQVVEAIETAISLAKDLQISVARRINLLDNCDYTALMKELERARVAAGGGNA